MPDVREPDELQISAVSALLGVPVPTIRSWERRYGFPAPGRTNGRHRRYSPAEVDQLRTLRDLITDGHSARAAVALMRRSTVRGTGNDADRRAVIDAALALDSGRLRDTLDAAAERNGVESAISEVTLPAMREIGTGWQRGECGVEHEHLATDTVRTWLARQAFLAPPAYRPRPIVLACGPADLHTVGLEGFGVLLARRGWSCRVLGAMTPVPALVGTVRALDAAAAIVTAQRGVTRRTAGEAINAVAAISGTKAFYAGRAFTARSARRDVRGTYLGDDLLEAVRILEAGIR